MARQTANGPIGVWGQQADKAVIEGRLSGCQAANAASGNRYRTLLHVVVLAGKTEEEQNSDTGRAMRPELRDSWRLVLAGADFRKIPECVARRSHERTRLWVIFP